MEEEDAEEEGVDADVEADAVFAMMTLRPRFVALDERDLFLHRATRMGVEGGDIRDWDCGGCWCCGGKRRDPGPLMGEGGGGAFLWMISCCARSWLANWERVSGVRSRRPFSSYVDGEIERVNISAASLRGARRPPNSAEEADVV